MSALAPTAPRGLAPGDGGAPAADALGAGDRLFASGGATLEELITATWDDLAAQAPASCPVCSESLGAGGRCHGCGSELS